VLPREQASIAAAARAKREALPLPSKMAAAAPAVEAPLCEYEEERAARVKRNQQARGGAALRPRRETAR
jgi:hypothetical protein